MRKPIALLALTPAVAAALAVSACGTKTIDHESLQDELAEQLAPQAGVDASQISVSCPEDEEVEKGRKFDCRLTAPNGDKLTVNVTLSNDDGGFTATVPEQ